MFPCHGSLNFRILFQVHVSMHFIAQECTTARELLASKIASLVLPSDAGEVKTEIASLHKVLGGEDSWR